MDRLVIDTEILKDVAGQFSSINTALIDEYQDLRSALLYVKLAAFGQINIINSVATLSTRVNKAAERARTLSSSCRSAAEMWEKCEECIKGLDNGKPKNIYEQLFDRIKSIFDKMHDEAEKRRQRREAEKQEYITIMHETKGNPWNNPRVKELIDERLRDIGLNEKQVKTIDSCLENADPTYRELFLRTFYDYDINTNPPSADCDGYYSPSENTFYLIPDALGDGEDFADTFFHESGHAIDENTGKRSQSDELLTNLTQETETYIREKIEVYGDDLSQESKDKIVNEIMNGRHDETTYEYGLFGDKLKIDVPDNLNRSEKKVYKKIIEASYTELKNTDHESDCIPWDVMSGMTNNIITGRGGHRKSYTQTDYYWFDQNGQRSGKERSEAYAENFSAKMTGDTNSQNTNNRYMHDSVDCMDRMVRDARDSVKNQN